MPEPLKCPKCGETNVRTYVNHRGWKVGKCHEENCGFWGNICKAEEGEIEVAKQAHAKRTGVGTKSKAAPASRGPSNSGGGKPVDDPVPVPEPKPRYWWDRDIFDLID